MSEQIEIRYNNLDNKRWLGAVFGREKKNSNI